MSGCIPIKKLAPPEATRVEYKVDISSPIHRKNQKLVTGDGLCIRSSRADFAILTRAHFDPALDGQTRKIMATVTINLNGVGRQGDRGKASSWYGL
ncbi:unnamed protein product [Penicillium roqueforti FM164]|uniref:Genomic scaffold, ProqFM164S02 n=1 Tax=Penicillium roqueforti (strain FM164) TaxID=1365484 RepID=W6QAA0_PENRF|nr:unnamed protein product [Penicillium roqueforti FM164]